MTQPEVELQTSPRVTDDDQVLVTIITDGLENNSHEYDYML